MRDPHPAEPLFDTRAFRDALGGFATGVTVITTRDDDGRPVGLTVSSFNSVSLDPPLVLWSLSLSSPNLAAFQRCSHYAVNVLAAEQEALSAHFAASGIERFGGMEVQPGLGEAPLLAGCCAWFECRNEARHAGGDHVILVGRVERFTREDRPPLLFHGGRYRRLA